MTATPNRGARALDAFLRGPAVVVLSLVLLVLVNWYAARRYTRFDWTSAGSFTLSSRSVEIVRGLREPVDLYVLLARDEPLYADVSELAERYAASSARVRLHYIDPDRQRERLLGLSQEVGLQLLRAALGLAGIGGVAHHLELRLARQQGHEAAAEQGVIVDHEDADAFRHVRRGQGAMGRRWFAPTAGPAG